MRSKEVEKAIKIVLAVRGTYDSYNDMMFGTGYSDKEVQGAIDTVLAYISELEEDNIHWRGKYHLLSRKPDITIKILIKIQELEKQLQEYEESDMEEDEDYLFDTNAMRSTIQVLKEIIGESDEK